MIVSEPVIRMENIIKRYYIGKPNELQILNGISLSVDQGEFVSIVGESGSGKSTLIHHVFNRFFGFFYTLLKFILSFLFTTRCNSKHLRI